MLLIARSKNVSSTSSGLGGFHLGQNNQIIFEVMPVPVPGSKEAWA
jgi:hypothetical protein